MTKITPKTSKKAVLDVARRVIGIEADALNALKAKLGDSFIEAVELILGTKGKVVITGMGKSGLICQKMASTFASTGTSAFFLHPAEGAHGDLGVLGRGDLLIAVSNSGESEEIVKTLPIVRRMGIKIIAMTGRSESTLATRADVTIDISVAEEACPLGLAPTASTTATLAMGDALAVALLERRGFREEDFAILHPAGSLGKRFITVEEVMHSGEALPRVVSSTPMKDALLEMTDKRMGLVGVFDKEGGTKLEGVITDGDLRRALSGEEDINVFTKTASEIMSTKPKFIAKNALGEAALKIMEDHAITALFVTDGGETAGDVVGVVHLHDLVRAGVI